MPHGIIKMSKGTRPIDTTTPYYIQNNYPGKARHKPGFFMRLFQRAKADRLFLLLLRLCGKLINGKNCSRAGRFVRTAAGE